MALLDIERKYAWSFWGFVLGTISLIVTIGVIIYTEKKDSFDLDVIVDEEFALIDLKERIPDLQIIYQNTNMLETKKEIKVIRLKLKNKGKNILQSMYDTNQQFGILFPNSVILDFEIENTNSEYLRENIDPRISFNNSDSIRNFLKLNKLILEKDKFITLKLFLLQNKAEAVTVINVLGKIAGIDKINVLKNSDIKKESAIDRKILVYILIGYFGLLLFLILIAFLLVKIESYQESKLIKSFLKDSPQFEDKIDVIKELIKSRYTKRIAKSLINSDEVIYRDIVREPSQKIFDYLLPRNMSNYIIFSKKIFKIEEDKIKLNEENVEIIKAFFLKSKNTKLAGTQETIDL